MASLLRGAFAIAAGGVLFVACGLGVDFDRYTRGNKAADGALGDATSDAELDAGTDARSFCEQRADAAFCSEFTTALGDSGWTIEKAGSATIGLSSEQFTSAPTALKTTMPSAGPKAYVAKDFAGPITYARVEFSLRAERLDTVTASSSLDVASIGIGTGPADEQLDDVRVFLHGDGTVAVEEATADGGYEDPAALIHDVRGSFTTFALEVDVTARAARLSVGGQERSFTLRAGSWRPGMLRVRVGSVFGMNSAQPWSVFHDDVVVFTR